MTDKPEVIMTALRMAVRFAGCPMENCDKAGNYDTEECAECKERIWLGEARRIHDAQGNS
jgi:hypothetical protein